MISGLDYFRELNIASVLLRLVLAMAFGGMIGLERGRKHRAAGFRTYMLVCLGSALTSILSQYLFVQLGTVWAEIAVTTGKQVDVSRLGAKVYSGIGFLAAGTIIVTGRQEVKGMTTAAGLWASACMGIAIEMCIRDRCSPPSPSLPTSPSPLHRPLPAPAWATWAACTKRRRKALKLLDFLSVQKRIYALPYATYAKNSSA